MRGRKKTVILQTFEKLWDVSLMSEPAETDKTDFSQNNVSSFYLMGNVFSNTISVQQKRDHNLHTK